MPDARLADEVPMPELATKNFVEAGFARLDAKIDVVDAKLSGKIDAKHDHLARQFHDDLDEHRRWVAGAVVALAAMMLTGFGALSVLIITTS